MPTHTLTNRSGHPYRLQLGAGRLEWLPSGTRSFFLSSSWLHLGDELQTDPLNRAKRFVKHIIGRLPSNAEIAEMYARTNFAPFLFSTNDRLQFEDGAFTFVFSEHFFEHLSYQVASELFRECYRILARGGVLRTCVPDAVLRTYEPPEPVGFPVALPPDHPQKHRTRWTVYTLSQVLTDAAFEVVPVTYCTTQGKYINPNVTINPSTYNTCLDFEMIGETRYIKRPQSLIIDAIKP
jgi:predicted SAM-dependent methyltransferase